MIQEWHDSLWVCFSGHFGPVSRCSWHNIILKQVQGLQDPQEMKKYEEISFPLETQATARFKGLSRESFLSFGDLAEAFAEMGNPLNEATL